MTVAKCTREVNDTKTTGLQTVFILFFIVWWIAWTVRNLGYCNSKKNRLTVLSNWSSWTLSRRVPLQVMQLLVKTRKQPFWICGLNANAHRLTHSIVQLCSLYRPLDKTPLETLPQRWLAIKLTSHSDWLNNLNEPGLPSWYHMKTRLTEINNTLLELVWCLLQKRFILVCLIAKAN